ncbi:hypothetical protein J6590_107224, partial [Homalodisca vitripennis]
VIDLKNTWTLKLFQPTNQYSTQGSRPVDFSVLDRNTGPPKSSAKKVDIVISIQI